MMSRWPHVALIGVLLGAGLAFQITGAEMLAFQLVAGALALAVPTLVAEGARARRESRMPPQLVTGAATTPETFARLRAETETRAARRPARDTREVTEPGRPRAVTPIPLPPADDDDAPG